MAKIIPILDEGIGFDPHVEAVRVAVNEACNGDGPDGKTPCTLAEPCDYCSALATLVEKALLRAFVAGQASMIRLERETNNVEA